MPAVHIQTCFTNRSVSASFFDVVDIAAPDRVKSFSCTVAKLGGSHVYY